jgi:hypothetical protein
VRLCVRISHNVRELLYGILTTGKKTIPPPAVRLL